jgi:hypothetical protein
MVDIDVEMVEVLLLNLSRNASAMMIHGDRIEDPLMIELANGTSAATHALIHLFAEVVDVRSGDDPTDDDIPDTKIDTDDIATCGHSTVWDINGQSMCSTCGGSRTSTGWAVL